MLSLLQRGVRVVGTVGQLLGRGLSVAVPVLVDDLGVDGLGAGDVGGGHALLLLVEQVLQEGEDCKRNTVVTSVINKIYAILTRELEGHQTGDQSLERDQLDDGQ